MTKPFAVRIAALDDVKELVALCDALNAHSGLPTGRLRQRDFRAALFGPKAFMTAHVARASGRGRPMIGYLLSHDSFTTDFGERGLYVVDLFVAEGWRRSGVATALMSACARRAKQRGASHMWWASMPRNFPARRFYAGLGATDEAIHSHAIFGKPFDRLAKRRGRR
ncbi:MAG: GNAT family N-acetyltransferase [Parvularculaceae bacterium]|jgi:GNAT superfamily N-acetyltransferase|nr:GNAT family N-acetyltransferase [Parvularculaceae bacterium]